jgi:hypothetical protein
MRCNRHALREACKFIRRHLPVAPLALAGATFTIGAEVRAENRGVRYRVISRWREGESVPVALEKAAAVWAQLPKEKHLN